MVIMVPEHLMQSVETDDRLTSPVQQTTLTRVVKDIKHITDSQLANDHKIVLSQHLIQRYQGLKKQRESETTAARPVVLPTPTDTMNITAKLESTPATRSKIPCPQCWICLSSKPNAFHRICLSYYNQCLWTSRVSLKILLLLSVTKYERHHFVRRHRFGNSFIHS